MHLSKKNGISMMMLVISVSVMMVIITSASVIGINSVNTANFEEYKSVLDRISDDVNYYYIQNETLPVKNIDGMETIDAKSISSEFYTQVISFGDENNKLYVIDLEKLEDSTINSSDKENIYVVAENSHNVYSIIGFKYKSKVYYKI